MENTLDMNLIIDDSQAESVVMSNDKYAIKLFFSKVLAGGGNGSGVDRLSQLKDVFLTQVEENDILVYNGVKWVNTKASRLPGAGEGDETPGIYPGRWITCSAYISSAQRPATPLKSQGSYNFETNTLTPPSGWSVSAEDMKGTIWETKRTFYDDGTSTNWSVPAPVDYAGTSLKSTVVYVYKSMPKGETPAKPVGGSYDFKTGRFTTPEGWEISSNGMTDVVWTSFATFYSDGTFSGWCDPFQFIDFDKIFEDLNKELDKIYQDMMDKANNDLADVLANANLSIEEANRKIEEANGKIQEAKQEIINAKQVIYDAKNLLDGLDASGGGIGLSEDIAKIRLFAQWYDKNAMTITDLASVVDGIKGEIYDWGQTIDAYNERINEVYSGINSVKGTVEQWAKTVDAANETVTRVGETIDSVNGQITLFGEKIKAQDAIVNTVQTQWDTEKATIESYAEVINTAAQTVSSAKETIDGAKATIEQKASYIDTVAGTVNEAVRKVDGMNGKIEDAVTAANTAKGEASRVAASLDAFNAEWKVEVQTTAADAGTSAAQIAVSNNKIIQALSGADGIGASIIQEINKAGSQTSISSDKIVLNGTTIAQVLNATDVIINNGASNFKKDGSGGLCYNAIYWGTDKKVHLGSNVIITYDQVSGAPTATSIANDAASAAIGYVQNQGYITNSQAQTIIQNAINNAPFMSYDDVMGAISTGTSGFLTNSELSGKISDYLTANNYATESRVTTITKNTIETETIIASKLTAGAVASNWVYAGKINGQQIEAGTISANAIGAGNIAVGTGLTIGTDGAVFNANGSGSLGSGLISWGDNRRGSFVFGNDNVNFFDGVNGGGITINGNNGTTNIGDRSISISDKNNYGQSVFIRPDQINIGSHTMQDTYITDQKGVSREWYQYSDMRLKNVHEDTALSLSQLADAPLFKYNYIGEDAVKIGTSAQYWNLIIPESVSEFETAKGGVLTMNYAEVALASAISLAKIVKRQQDEIDALKTKLSTL